MRASLSLNLIVALLGLVAAGCRTPINGGHLAAADAAPPAAFLKVCAHPDDAGPDAALVLKALRASAEFSTGGPVPECAGIWAGFMATRRLGAVRLKDLSPLAMLADVPGLEMDVDLDGMPAHLETLVGLDLAGVSFMVPFDAVQPTPAETAMLLATVVKLDKLRFLGFVRLHLPDLSALAPMTWLKGFAADDTALGSLGFLAKWSDLEELGASGNHIVDLTPLQNLLALRALDLERNAITSLDTIITLGNLRDLSLNDNPAIAGILALQYLSLRQLSLKHAAIADITPLKSQALEYLDLEGNPITSIEVLRHQPIRYLNLSDSKVADLAPIADLPALEDLDAARVPATSFPKLAPDARLAYLYMPGAAVADLCALLAPPRLKDVTAPDGTWLVSEPTIAAHRCP